ncbi:MAG: lysylphosphatidylglycerol synthase domain-containing protein [Pseudomonadota bacterium]|nr:lysylphosphatidylglycerol synthase domain-containing protein [Pseudomonadota bacterium]
MSAALRWLWKSAPWALTAVLVVLLARQARSRDWALVAAALKAISLASLAAAAALAVASHALFSTYDLISRAIVRHRLGRLRTAWVGAVCYAFNLSFGALVGGMAMRLRLYTRLGLPAATAGQVIALSMLTNWLGYGLLTGLVLLVWPPTLPAAWPVSVTVLQVCGVAMTLTALAYLLACGFARQRSYRFRGHLLALPSGRMASLQAATSSLNWLLMAALIWTLLGGRADYGGVVASLLLAAIAGVLTHVPAGLGVLEAVFIATLKSEVPQAQLLAALLAYRAVYYLLPLTWAVPGYLLMEMGTRSAGATGQAVADRSNALKPG